MELWPSAQDWKEMFLPPISWGEVLLRPAIMYLTLLVLLRLSGKKQMAQLTLFDFLIILTVSEAAQNGIIGKDESVLGSIVSVAVLIGLSLFFDRVTYQSSKAGDVLEGKPSLLIYKGKLVGKNLGKESISDDELRGTMRLNGIASLEEIRYAIMEVTGTVSIIRADAPEPEKGSEKDTITEDIRRQVAEFEGKNEKHE